MIRLSKYKIPDEIVDVQIFRELPIEIQVHLINNDIAPLGELYEKELKNLKVSIRDDYRSSYQNARNNIDFEIDFRLLDASAGYSSYSSSRHIDYCAVPEQDVDKKIVEEYAKSLIIK